MYEYGSGVKKDPEKALELYKQGLKKNNSFFFFCQNLTRLKKKKDATHG